MGVEKKGDRLFEASWEICNKVGGIYTVVKTKAEEMINLYGHENYVMVGPYFEDKVQGIFEEELAPDDIRHACEALAQEGIHVHYGVWHIKGKPKTILIDFQKYFAHADEIKGQLFTDFGVDSLSAGYEYSEPVVWAWCVGKFLEKVSRKGDVGHFHEWLAGAGLLFCKKNVPHLATTFTTHATMLGRTLANSGVELYEVLDKINPEEEARRYNMLPKFTMERACAHNAHCFTTVSGITGIEAQYILGKEPHKLVPNGMYFGQIPSFDVCMLKHRKLKHELQEFIMYHFTPYYQMEIRDTLILFTAARYEVHTKGIDLLIDALATVNHQLKEQGSKKNVVVFFWVPSGITHVKHDVIENRNHFEDIKDEIEEEFDSLKRSLLNRVCSNEEVCQQDLFEPDVKDNLDIKARKFKKSGTPPLCTHDLQNPNDPILQMFQEKGLTNKEEDKVKVVFYPIYLTGADGLLNLDYYECLQAAHLGIFPSYYEPWGYTPLEAASLGTASITTDLSGFGKYLLEHGGDKDIEKPGIYVLRRMGKSYHDACHELAQTITQFINLDKPDRVKNKFEARMTAEQAGWKKFAVHYVEAHNFALERLD